MIQYLLGIFSIFIPSSHLTLSIVISISSPFLLTLAKYLESRRLQMLLDFYYTYKTNKSIILLSLIGPRTQASLDTLFLFDK